ncbi:MAG TPA: MaoC/PaaZ C-terminal domain-containing protein [Polyangiaceae bacterium]|nr:MaoC/PaaZ C-terminal domain-containing protein [Polyangiaceae bacterium]
MSVSILHVLSQGPMIAALGRVAVAGRRPSRRAAPAETPGPWFERRVAPPPPGLVRDYLRHVGGDPGHYRGRLPWHLFPQWGLPLAARAIARLPYPLAHAVNAGCRVDSRSPLPAGERLHVRARVEAIDDDGARAIVTQRIVTGTASTPDAVVADVQAFVPLGPRRSATSRRRPRAVLPETAREIAFLRVAAGAGLDFAMLTGDFNPVHWLRPYARASGFDRCILHGFSTLARAVEALNPARFSGDPTRLDAVEARFTSPLTLPASIGVYVGDGGRFWVADAPNGRVYLEGHSRTDSKT